MSGGGGHRGGLGWVGLDLSHISNYNALFPQSFHASSNAHSFQITYIILW